MTKWRSTWSTILARIVGNWFVFIFFIFFFLLCIIMLQLSSLNTVHPLLAFLPFWYNFVELKAIFLQIPDACFYFFFSSTIIIANNCFSLVGGEYHRDNVLLQYFFRFARMDMISSITFYNKWSITSSFVLAFGDKYYRDSILMQNFLDYHILINIIFYNKIY